MKIFKEESSYDISEINKIFSDVSNLDIMNNDNKKWLWHNFNIINYLYLNKGDLTLKDIENALNQQYDIVLDNKILNYSTAFLFQNSNKFYSTLIPIISSKFKSKQKDKKYDFLTVVYKLTSIFIISFIIILLVNLNLFNSVISIIIFSILAFLTYKLMYKLKNNKNKQHINDKLKQSITNINNNKTNQLINIIDLQMLHSDNEINKELNILKTMSISLINLKNNDNYLIEQDLYKMWKEHIPTILEQNDKQIIIKAIQAMKVVLNNYLEHIFWEKSRKTKIIEKYWLAKISEEVFSN